MTTEEFKEIMCGRCVNHDGKCNRQKMKTEEMKDTVPEVQRVWCDSYKKWSGFINQSFKNLDWRDGRDAERKENRYRNNL